MLGSSTYFLRSMASSRLGPLPVRSTRRSATVTISAPDASSASRVSSSEAYLPVPTMMRDVKVRPPSDQVSDIDMCFILVAKSAAADEGD